MMKKNIHRGGTEYTEGRERDFMKPFPTSVPSAPLWCKIRIFNAEDGMAEEEYSPRDAEYTERRGGIS
jgi:hypothetical protein